MFCPKCRGEYRPGVEVCADCGVQLVERHPDSRAEPEQGVREPDVRFGDGPPHLDNLTTAFEASDPALIPVAESVLRSAEIPYTIERGGLQDLLGGGRLGGFNLVTGPVRFLVREEHAAQARKLLAEISDDASSGETSDESNEAVAIDRSEALDESHPIDDPPSVRLGASWLEVMAILSVLSLSTWITPLYNLYWGTTEPASSSLLLSELLAILESIPTILLVLWITNMVYSSPQRFGLVRVRASDLGVGLAILVMQIGVGTALAQLFSESEQGQLLGRLAPVSPVDYLVSFVAVALGAFAEELVFRAYLITQLATLTKSRVAAILISSAIFATNHLYQGAAGVASAFALGLLTASFFSLMPRIWPVFFGHLLWNLLATWGTG